MCGNYVGTVRVSALDKYSAAYIFDAFQTQHDHDYLWLPI